MCKPVYTRPHVLGVLLIVIFAVRGAHAELPIEPIPNVEKLSP